MQKRGYTDTGKEPMVHPSPCERSGNCEQQPSNQKEVGRVGGRPVSGFESQNQSANGESVYVRPKTLEELLFKYPCCPPEAFTNINVVIIDYLAFIKFS